jgi:hypothetical protein
MYFSCEGATQTQIRDCGHKHPSASIVPEKNRTQRRVKRACLRLGGGN